MTNTLSFWRQPRFWVTLVVAWVVIAVGLRLLERVMIPTVVWFSEQWIVHLAMYVVALAGAWLAARAVARGRPSVRSGFEVIARDRDGPGSQP